MTPSPLKFDAQRLAEWSQGAWNKPVEQSIVQIVHDSRSVRDGSVFIAIRGERFDGHSFVEQLGERGAVGAIVDHTYEPPSGLDIPLLRVADTGEALKNLAREYRRSCGTLIVGITGSAGKTTVKDMIADVLSTQGRTSRTPGNWNNDIGLPLSILAMQPRSEFGVFELGTNHPGEIGELSSILNPICGVLTNVGLAHVGHFGSIDAVAEEKAELLRALPEEGVAILDRDDARFDWFCAQTSARIVTVSLKGNADYIMAGGGPSVTISEAPTGEHYTMTLPLPGEHVKQNALRAIAVAREFGLAPHQIVESLEQFNGGSMRWQQEEAGGFSIINDAYNANPISMSAAMDAFAQSEATGNKWVVLGGMRELGEFEADSHREVGARATCGDFAGAIFVGELASLMAAGATGDTFYSCSDNAAAAERIKNLAAPGDHILLKGSRAEHLEQLIELLS